MRKLESEAMEMWDFRVKIYIQKIEVLFVDGSVNYLLS